MNIRNKSIQNIKAAELLIKNSDEKEQYYASSIHCAYYSCFQLLKYTLNCKCDIKIPYCIQNSKTKSMSHENIKDAIIKDLQSNAEFYELTTFRTSFSNLKKLRMKADYYNQIVDLTDAKEDISDEENIKNILYEKYKIS